MKDDDASRSMKLLRQHYTAVNRIREITQELEVLRAYEDRDAPTEANAPEMAAVAYGVTEGILWGLDHYAILWITILERHYGPSFDGSFIYDE